MSQRKESIVWGVGSFATLKGLRPLVLFNEKLLADSVAVARLLTYQQLPPHIHERLLAWECPKSTIFLAVTEPETLSTSVPVQVITGDLLQCQSSNERGTIGPRVEISDQLGNRCDGLLTAGHVTRAGVGSVIEALRQRRWMAPLASVIGSVALHEDPSLSGNPGYDVSVIKLNNNAIPGAARHAGVASIGPLSEPRLCTMYAGFTGTVNYSAIVGALTVYGNGQRQWVNSWLMVPSTLAQRGDSGSLVCTSDTMEGVGMLVGGSRVANSLLYLCWYAQDLSSIQANVLSQQRMKFI